MSSDNVTKPVRFANDSTGASMSKADAELRHQQQAFKHFGNWKQMLIRDMVLPVRGPCLLLLGYSLYNTYLYNEGNKAFDRDARFGTVHGKLLEIKKLNYFYNAVPRYAVLYEYTVDGKTYTSRRATTGSFYRDWMPGHFYTDTITESQYLQAYPVLRQSEPCTVYYDKRAPGRHSALAADSNSAESGVALYLGVFPLIFANMMKNSFMASFRKMRPPRYRVGFPEYDKAASPTQPPPRS